MTEVIHSALDQTLSIAKQELVQIEGMVNDVVGECIETGHINPAINFVSSLRSSVHVRALGMAMLLWLLKQYWEDIGIEDNFLNVMEADCGLSPETSRKYVRMWGNIFENSDVPDNVKAQLLWWPIGRLLAVYAAIGEGALEDRWEDLLAVNDDREARALVEGQGGGVGGFPAISIVLTRDGTLMAGGEEDGVEVYEPFGSFNMKKAESMDIIGKAVSRIVRESRIQEQ